MQESEGDCVRYVAEERSICHGQLRFLHFDDRLNR